VLYVYEMESPRAIRMAAAVGGRAPLHCTAVGKVLLAFQPPEYVKDVIQQGLTAYTPKTVTKRDALLEMLDEVRLREHAVDDEESESGLRAIAAPVHDRSGRVVAAINISTHSSRTSLGQLRRDLLPPLLAAAALIEADLELAHGDSGTRPASGA
jgi:IclR family pca regulon transcriptional regulator